MKKQIIALVLIALCCFAGCGQNIRQTLQNDGIHSIRNYQFNPESEISARIQPVPAKFLDTLMQMDGRSDYRAYSPNAEEIKLFRAYLSLLPALNRKAMQRSTVAVYFVKNFVGAGMADFIVGENNEIFTILLVNPDVMKKSMEQWLCYRDESGYKKDGTKVHVEFNCGGKYRALLYLLLHESSHIADYVYRATPYTDPESAEIYGVNKNAPFTYGIWLDYRKPVEQYIIPDTGRLSPYALGETVIPLSSIVMHYTKLKNTPFVSLYGSRNWSEDFADSAVVYHLTQKMKLTYTVNVYSHGEKALSYTPSSNPLVRERWKNLAFLYEE